MHGITSDLKGFLALMMIIVIIVLALPYYFRFILKPNPVSRAFLVITLVFLAACYGAVKEGVIDKWVSSWINLII